ncbi:cornifelin homolog B-like [Genypterus blacodes]|uniref:cornifelin homolog B-like n=1 Tax=Genypterus blacodes TaxID=154954 RepID=UPI003F76E7F5
MCPVTLTALHHVYKDVLFHHQVAVIQVSNLARTQGKHEAVTMSTSNVTTISQPKPFIMTTMSNKWSSGICDCFQDMTLCCFCCWCPGCFACKTAYDAGECLCLPLLDTFGLVPPIALALRVSLRQRYGIEDTICNDCVYAFFCVPCNWCQMAREIKTRANPITFVNMSI